MTTIVIDAALREMLFAAGDSVELRDESGALVAHAFVNRPIARPASRMRRFLRTLLTAIAGDKAYIAVQSKDFDFSVREGSEAFDDRYARFSDRARKVMQLANREAERFHHEYIGTEHVLLGLVKEGNGVAASILKNLDVDLRKIRLEIEKVVQHGPGGEQVIMGRLPHTPRAKKVLEYTIEEARNLNHNYIGTEHLLLGLLREEEGVAAQVLMNLGLKLEDVRLEVLNLLGHPPS